MKYTLILLALIFISFIFQILIKGYTQFLALIPSKVLRGEFYRIVTSIFLHGDEIHLFYNSFALLIFGSVLEKVIGSRRYLLVFFLSGIIGSIAYILTSILLNEINIPAVGASGAIYGIIGTLAILRPTTIVLVYFVPIPLLFFAFFWIIVESLATLFQFFGAKTGIASQAHLAGILFGIFYGYKLKEKGRIRIRYEI
ncbi:MAG: rhomboid family intramembrane serine protease [Candidatus Aenigmatarchaeota archaeon]